MNAQPALHPADQTLQAYGLGQLDDASAGWVNAHLEACPACRRRVAEISSDRSLGHLRDARPRPDTPAPVGSMLADLSTLGRGAAAPPAPPPASPLPRGLAESRDYEVISELGRGGMGVVFLARNTLMGRLEVLKVVSGTPRSRREVLERFLREIRSAARLRHPNIVAAYSALRLGESLVLAMEYAEGLDLAGMVKARGPLPVAEACSYVQQAAMGLQHAHEHGMVHRDIKPANLILAREGDEAVIKVLDFGLAKVTSEDQVDTGLTREGQMLGTPDDIAPEQSLDAQKAEPFWPPLAPDDIKEWRVSDPDSIEMDETGVFVSAGPNGNFLLTRRANYRGCSLTLDVSATKGTEAFLALRAHRGPDGWRAITSRVIDEGGRIHAGGQSADFRVPERGKILMDLVPARRFHVVFQIDRAGAARLVVKQKDTSRNSYADLPAGESAGAVGVFVRSGTLIVHGLDVEE